MSLPSPASKGYASEEGAMNSRPDYTRAIERVLRRHTTPPSHGDIKALIVRDAEQGHYLLMNVGWNNGERIHGVVVHLRLAEGRVFLEHNGILDSPDLIDQLVRAGIPRAAIVPAYWQQPEEGIALPE